MCGHLNNRLKLVRRDWNEKVTAVERTALTNAARAIVTPQAELQSAAAAAGAALPPSFASASGSRFGWSAYGSSWAGLTYGMRLLQQPVQQSVSEIKAMTQFERNAAIISLNEIISRATIMVALVSCERPRRISKHIRVLSHRCAILCLCARSVVSFCNRWRSSSSSSSSSLIGCWGMGMTRRPL